MSSAYFAGYLRGWPVRNGREFNHRLVRNGSGFAAFSMNGWGSIHLTIAPDGTALPCQEARLIKDLEFPNVRDHGLDWIWRESPAFRRFRGDDWMKEPCRSCADREKDFGGCRCQAFLLTGDAANTDPVCTKSPHRHLIDDILIEAESKPKRTGADQLVMRERGRA